MWSIGLLRSFCSRSRSSSSCVFLSLGSTRGGPRMVSVRLVGSSRSCSRSLRFCISVSRRNILAAIFVALALVLAPLPAFADDSDESTTYDWADYDTPGWYSSWDGDCLTLVYVVDSGSDDGIATISSVTGNSTDSTITIAILLCYMTGGSYSYSGSSGSFSNYTFTIYSVRTYQASIYSTLASVYSTLTSMSSNLDDYLGDYTSSYFDVTRDITGWVVYLGILLDGIGDDVSDILDDTYYLYYIYYRLAYTPDSTTYNISYMVYRCWSWLASIGGDIEDILGYVDVLDTISSNLSTASGRLYYNSYSVAYWAYQIYAKLNTSYSYTINGTTYSGILGYWVSRGSYYEGLIYYLFAAMDDYVSALSDYLVEDTTPSFYLIAQTSSYNGSNFYWSVIGFGDYDLSSITLYGYDTSSSSFVSVATSTSMGQHYFSNSSGYTMFYASVNTDKGTFTSNRYVVSGSTYYYVGLISSRLSSVLTYVGYLDDINDTLDDVLGYVDVLDTISGRLYSNSNSVAYWAYLAATRLSTVNSNLDDLIDAVEDSNDSLANLLVVFDVGGDESGTSTVWDLLSTVVDDLALIVAADASSVDLSQLESDVSDLLTEVTATSRSGAGTTGAYIVAMASTVDDIETLAETINTQATSMVTYLGQLVASQVDYSSVLTDILDALGNLDIEVSTSVDVEVTVTDTQSLWEDVFDTLSAAVLAAALSNLSETMESVFPFCLVYLAVDVFDALAADPVTPSFSWSMPIDLVGTTYTFEVDLSDWDDVASLWRSLFVVVYALGLFAATKSYIYPTSGDD